jgi:hypothetical protein
MTHELKPLPRPWLTTRKESCAGGSSSARVILLAASSAGSLPATGAIWVEGSYPGLVTHRARVLRPDPIQAPWYLPRTGVADTVLDLAGAAKTFDSALLLDRRRAGASEDGTRPPPPGAGAAREGYQLCAELDGAATHSDGKRWKDVKRYLFR